MNSCTLWSNMIQSKNLQFLAFASIILAFTDAHYPYSQQQHYQTQHYGAQSYYPNGNYQHYNGINHDSSIVYSNINSNTNNNNYNNVQYDNNNNYNNIQNDEKNIDEFIKSNRRSSQNKNSAMVIKLPKVYLGDFEYVPTPGGYRFSYDNVDGTRHTEDGVIPDSENTGIYERDESVQQERMALRMRGRENSKKRKLSPKALQSLAG